MSIFCCIISLSYNDAFICCFSFNIYLIHDMFHIIIICLIWIWSVWYGIIEQVTDIIMIGLDRCILFLFIIDGTWVGKSQWYKGSEEGVYIQRERVNVITKSTYRGES